MNQAAHLDPADLGGIERILRERGWIAPGESVRSAARAGDGNMNLTLRVITEARSIIVKQSRPWVEKYPDIAAPADRALVEIAFYEQASERRELRARMPELLGSDRARRILVLEDLGEAHDFTALYAGATLGRPHLRALIDYLKALHEPFPPGERRAEIFTNREMRALNHEHIFRLPLDPESGLDLDGWTPGLAEAAGIVMRDETYRERVAALGALYLADGETLVHGDYFPGSWLRTSDGGVRVIDPEFCFLGPPAFDLGVLLAHLRLAGQPEALSEEALAAYGTEEATARLARRFAGVEIMRRLIGVAQLPLSLDLDGKRRLLEASRRLVLSD